MRRVTLIGVLLVATVAAPVMTAAAQERPGAGESCRRSGWQVAGQFVAGLTGAWVGGVVPFLAVINLPERRLKGDPDYHHLVANLAFSTGSWLGSAAGVYLASPHCRSAKRILVGTFIPSALLFAGSNDAYTPLVGVVIVAPLQAFGGTVANHRR